MPLLALDRKLDAEIRDELDALPPGRDDHGVGGQRAGARIQLPARCRRPKRVHSRDSNIRSAGERLHDGLRPVEVAVLVTPRSAGERLGPKPGHERRRLLRRHDARRNPLLVLDRDVRPQPLERCLGVGGEEIAAGAEAQLDREVELPLGLSPEGGGLAGEATGDRRAPLLAHASRLDARLARPDPRPLEDDHGRAAQLQGAGHGEPGDPGADNGDVGGLSRHSAPRGRRSPARPRASARARRSA